MGRMRILSVLMLAGMAGVVWAGGPPAPEEMVPNPEYAAWVKQKVGTYMVMKTTVHNRAADGSKVVVTLVERQKLLEVREWNIALEFCTKVDDHQALPRTIYVDAEKSKKWAGSFVFSTAKPWNTVKLLEEVKEEMEVSGVKYEALKRSLEIETNDKPSLKISVTVWTSDAVPGGLLKRIVTYAGGLGPRTEEMMEIGIEEVKKEEAATSQKSSPTRNKPRKW